MREILAMLMSFICVLGGGAATAQVARGQPRMAAGPSITLAHGPLPVEQAFRLKKSLGDAKFAADVEAALSRMDAEEDIVAGGAKHRAETVGGCASRAEVAAAAELDLVRRSSDAQAFARTRAAAEAALAERRALRALYLGGAPVAPPYGLVGRMVARAKVESNPRLAELYRRMAEDQFSKIDTLSVRPFLGPGVHTTWEKGLDDAALSYVDETISGEWCPMDAANAAWLKADIRRHGWYKISVYGADADRAAWLIVQHARHDLTFQKQVLTILEPLWRLGETRGQNYAMLYDVTAHLEGRLGRFGVVGECTARGVWTPAPVEDAATVDEWRAKAGMPPLAQQIAVRSRGCVDEHPAS